MRGDRARQPNAGEPRLVIAAKDLELGRVHETESLEHSFVVTNQGDRSVKITRIDKDCDCLGISPGKGAVLAAGEAKRFYATFSLARRPLVTGGSGAYPLRISFSMAYAIDDRTEWAEWQFLSTIIPTIQPKLLVLELGLVSERDKSFERSIEVAATKEVAGVTAIAPPQWSVNVTRVTGAGPTARFRVTVRPAKKTTPGLVNDTIRLVPETSDGRALPAKQVRIVGEVASDVVTTPREVHYGRQPRGAWFRSQSCFTH